MGVIIKQYEGSFVSPKDDAIMHEIFNDQSGVIRGCEITYLGSNQIRVGEGYLYICGRIVQIEEEVVLSPFAAEETEGELILKIDLLSETPGKLLARTPRVQLTQGDINGADSVFEYLLATYTVSDVAISGLTIDYEYITAGFSKDKILGTKEELNAVTESGFLVDALAVKEQFDELNSKLGGIKFGINKNGDYGFFVTDDSGEEVLIPFYQVVGKSVDLYNYGNQCIEITGGWINPTSISTSQCSYVMDSNGSNAGSIVRTVNEDNLYLKSVSAPSTGRLTVSSFYTKTRIDLTHYTKLKILFTASMIDMDGNALSITTKQVDPNGSSTSNATACLDIKGVSTDNVIERTLDISSLTGEQWVAITAFAYSGDSATGNIGTHTTTCKIYRVWLEK